MKRKCKNCGVEFEVSSKHREVQFCGKKCSAIYRDRNCERYTVKCEYCGIEFIVTKGRRKDPVRFCSRSCYDKYREESRPLCDHCGKRVKAGYQKKAKRHYCSPECRAIGMKPKPRPCINCGAMMVPVKYNSSAGRFVAYDAGKTCSAKCHNEWIRNNEERKEKISKAFTGSKHPNWQGGKSAFNKSCHRGPGWERIARKVRERDGNICQICGKTEDENGRALDVHHIIPYHNLNNHRKANMMKNLITLCKSCHRREDNKVEQKQIILPFFKIAQEKRREARI